MLSLITSIFRCPASTSTASDSGFPCIHGGNSSLAREHFAKRSLMYAAAHARYIPSFCVEEVLLDREATRPCRPCAVSTGNEAASVCSRGAVWA